MHLKSLQLAEDLSGSLCSASIFKLDYENRTINISILGYIKKFLQKLNYNKKNKQQQTRYQPAP